MASDRAQKKPSADDFTNRLPEEIKPIWTDFIAFLVNGDGSIKDNYTYTDVIDCRINFLRGSRGRRRVLLRFVWRPELDQVQALTILSRSEIHERPPEGIAIQTIDRPPEATRIRFKACCLKNEEVRGFFRGLLTKCKEKVV